MAKAATAPVTSKSKKVATPEEMKKKEDAAKRVNKPLVEKAVAALVKYHNEQAMKKHDDGKAIPLLGTDANIQVQFGLEMVPGKPSLKPVRVAIPHPLHKVAGSNEEEEESLEEVDVCLIVKDESKPWVQEMLSTFPEHLGCVKKVLGLESLRKKHSLFHQRRELLHKYDIFMADDRILPMLTAALGKDFVKAKKLPVPIRLTRKEALPFAVQKNLTATFMTISSGTSITVRAGNTGMPLNKLVDNVLAIAENAVDKIPRKWANIRSIAIKTPESTSLPFYNKTPEELLQIAEMAGVQPAFKDIPQKQDDNINSEEEEKKRKLAAAKSPLVRALKKQKKEAGEGKPKKEEESDEPMKEEEQAASDKKKEDAAKKGVKNADKVKKEQLETPKSQKKVKKEKAEESKTTSGKKKRRKESEDEKEKESDKGATSSPSKKSKAEDKEVGGDFIPSKKFKGSKKGYVFRAGKQGVGYYKDVKPVVNKMALQALFRSAEQSGKRGRSKSAGKRRGRR